MGHDLRDKGASFMKTWSLKSILTAGCVATKRAREGSFATVAARLDGDGANPGIFDAPLQDACNAFRVSMTQRGVETSSRQVVY